MCWVAGEKKRKCERNDKDSFKSRQHEIDSSRPPMVRDIDSILTQRRKAAKIRQVMQVEKGMPSFLLCDPSHLCAFASNGDAEKLVSTKTAGIGVGRKCVWGLYSRPAANVGTQTRIAGRSSCKKQIT